METTYTAKKLQQSHLNASYLHDTKRPVREQEFFL